ncbi:MAG: dioxygenase [Anaerolineae bacterium]
MKALTLLVMLIFLILLSGCGQAEAPAATPTTAAVAQGPSAMVPPSPLPPTQTPPPEPSETPVAPVPTTGQAEATAAPSATPRLDPTVTPSPEPAPTELAEPTAIPCTGTLTPSQQEGPYYSPGSPERSSLIDEGMPGVPVMIFGRVFDEACNPLAGAKLDFWLADVDGVYDNAGYRLRGHVFSDQQGNYGLESIEPTSYTGRPPHIHVKVFAPDGRELLTTQIYFAGSENSTEVTSSPELFANYLDPEQSGRLRVLFNFVVED